MKRSYSIFLDLLGKLCVRVLSVKGFVKIVDFVFVYSGECVTTTTYRRHRVEWPASRGFSLACKAFSVLYEVARVACQLRIWFVN